MHAIVDERGRGGRRGPGGTAGSAVRVAVVGAGEPDRAVAVVGAAWVDLTGKRVRQRARPRVRQRDGDSEDG